MIESTCPGRLALMTFSLVIRVTTGYFEMSLLLILFFLQGDYRQVLIDSLSHPPCATNYFNCASSITDIIYCIKYAGARHELRDEPGHSPDFSKMQGTAEGLRMTTK
jgi:hypothetical protein